jgi:uncharacterized protein (DUF2336 family)
VPWDIRSRTDGASEHAIALGANAETKSQGHLYAISQRATLSEAVTDVLVDRGEQCILRTVAANRGARFSNLGFRKLIERAFIGRQTLTEVE